MNRQKKILIGSDLSAKQAHDMFKQHQAKRRAEIERQIEKRRSHQRLACLVVAYIGVIAAATIYFFSH